MRNRLIAMAVMATSGLALAAAPVASDAAPHGKRVLVCTRDVHRKANNGTLIGAVGGGLVGNAVAGHGARTEGTLIGAGVGAVAGHSIAKSNAKKRRCHYEYR